MPPIQVSLDLFAVVLDGVLEADGRRRVRALSCRVTQAAQVGPEARCELPRDPAAVGVGDRPVQQGRVVGLSPRVEQLARLHPWLHGHCKGDRGKPGWWWVHEPRSGDEGDDEQDLKSDPTGHSQRDHPAYALMLRSRAPQLVRLPGLTARARRLGGRGHSHDVVYTAPRTRLVNAEDRAPRRISAATGPHCSPSQAGLAVTRDLGGTWRLCQPGRAPSGLADVRAGTLWPL